MKKYIVIFYFLLSFTLLYSQREHYYNLYGGVGLPMGKKIYETNASQSAALFANMSGNSHYAFESNFAYNETINLGYLLQYTHYTDWKSVEYNNRYNDITLNSFEVGFVASKQLNELSFNKFKTRFILTPFVSFLWFRNPNYNYFAQSRYVDEVGNKYYAVNVMKESKKSFSLLLPGLSASLEYSYSFSNSLGCFARTGITVGFANNPSSPEKYYAYPTASLGLSYSGDALHNVTNNIIEYTPQAAEPTKICDGNIRDFCFSPTFGKAYAISDNVLNIIDINKKTIIGNLDALNSNSFTSLDISSDGNMLMASSSNNTISVWSLSNNQLINTIEVANYEISDVCFAAKGSQILVGTKSGNILLFSTINGVLEKTVSPSTGSITSLVVDDNLTSLIATYSGGYVALLNSVTLELAYSELVHKEGANNSVFMPEQKQFYTVGNDGKVFAHALKGKEFTTRLVNNKFGSGKIVSVDVLGENALAFAEKNGRIYAFTRFSGFKFNSKHTITSMRFVKKDDYVIVAYATTKGLFLVNSLDMTVIPETISF